MEDVLVSDDYKIVTVGLAGRLWGVESSPAFASG